MFFEIQCSYQSNEREEVFLDQVRYTKQKLSWHAISRNEGSMLKKDVEEHSFTHSGEVGYVVTSGTHIHTHTAFEIFLVSGL